MACKLGDCRLAKALLECGANPQAEGLGHNRLASEDFQVFPLSVASLAGNVEMVRMLLGHEPGTRADGMCCRTAESAPTPSMPCCAPVRIPPLFCPGLLIRVLSCHNLTRAGTPLQRCNPNQRTSDTGVSALYAACDQGCVFMRCPFLRLLPRA